MKFFTFAYIFGAAAQYPDCVNDGFIVKGGEKVVRVIIDPVEHVNVGVLEPLNSGFRVNGTDACSLICAKRVLCDWWSIEEESGECGLWNVGGDTTINGMRTQQKVKTGHRTCTTSTWPGCLQKGIYIDTTGYVALWVDLTSFNSTGCRNDNCAMTDQFTSTSVEECAAMCTKIYGCMFWSFGDDTCWLRRGKVESFERVNYISGTVQCAFHAPPV